MVEILSLSDIKIAANPDFNWLVSDKHTTEPARARCVHHTLSTCVNAVTVEEEPPTMLRSALHSPIIRHGFTKSIVKRSMAGSASSETSAVSEENEKKHPDVDDIRFCHGAIYFALFDRNRSCVLTIFAPKHSHTVEQDGEYRRSNFWWIRCSSR